jgi:dTMP kinase
MFITFEGIDLSGKSTQILLLLERLREAQQDTILVREPGGTLLSERIRDLLLDREHGNMDEVTEFLLFSSSRSQLVREVILPALDAGKHVIADRFYDSSTAYQGYGRGLDLEDLLRVHHLATHGLSPQLTFLIDIPVEESFARRSRRSGNIDRMENASKEFYTRVRNGYAALADEHKKRIVSIDGLQSVETIAETIWRLTSCAMDLPGTITERA